MTQRKLTFYCDFDGTIAERDMIGAIMKKFVPTEGQVIVEEVNAKRRTVKDGVEALFRLIPSRDLRAVVDYAVGHTKIRAGFHEFVEAVRKHDDWRLTVVSGGFDFFVHPVIETYGRDVAVFCNSLDSSQEYLRVRWHTTCDESCEGGCGLCKPTVIRTTAGPNETVIVVGDGVTDLKAARTADFVFARDRLLTECERLGLPHAPFDTFYDILNHPLVRDEEAVSSESH